MNRRLFGAVTAIAVTAASLAGCKETDGLDWEFDGSISPEVLDNYLSRAMTLTEFLTVDPYCIDGSYPDKQADIDLMRDAGVKFVGRSIYRWGHEEVLNDPAFWSGAKTLVDIVHEMDPDIIFQAGVFEAVYRDVETIHIPEWTFHALGLPAEDRNFRYSDMLFPDGRFVDQWGPGGSVPDIRRMETQLWLMYLVGSYVDIGIESIHLGQVMLMGAEDEGWRSWEGFLDKARRYAGPRARRHLVMFDAHAGSRGMIVDGNRSLLDFNAYPLRVKEVPERPMEGVLEVGFLDAIYCKSPACVTPSGWYCDALPYLVEFDNFGPGPNPGTADLDDHFVWGYDEISWFYGLSHEEKVAWLEYAYKWIEETDPAGHLEMPGARVINTGEGPVFISRAVADNSQIKTGMDIADAICRLWNGMEPRVRK